MVDEVGSTGITHSKPGSAFQVGPYRPAREAYDLSLLTLQAGCPGNCATIGLHARNGRLTGHNERSRILLTCFALPKRHLE